MDNSLAVSVKRESRERTDQTNACPQTTSYLARQYFFSHSLTFRRAFSYFDQRFCKLYRKDSREEIVCCLIFFASVVRCFEESDLNCLLCNLGGGRPWDGAAVRRKKRGGGVRKTELVKGKAHFLPSLPRRRSAARPPPPPPPPASPRPAPPRHRAAPSATPLHQRLSQGEVL
jgi:hypothetical protein